MVEWASGVLLCFLTSRRTEAMGGLALYVGTDPLCVCMRVSAWPQKDFNALCRQLFWCVCVCACVCLCRVYPT